MPLESLRLSAIFPVPPKRIYEAWLDGTEHGRFTGGKATCDARVGGAHSAWDGYIRGKNIELVPHERIVQSWRTQEFPKGAKDSRLELTFERAGDGTEVTLVHTEIPEGQGKKYEEGWMDHYFEPMARYFRRPTIAPPPPKKAKAKKKPAAKKKTKKTTTKKRKVK